MSQRQARGAHRPAIGTVVITGGSAGVGRATAEIYARRGWRVGIIARERARDAAVAGELARAGAEAVLAVPADVADQRAVEQAADRFERELGPIDVWVNDAMTTVYAPFIEVEPDEFERVTQVTYLGGVNGTRAALSKMLPRRRGAIVTVASGIGYHGLPLQSAYCGAKFALRGFIQSVRGELMHEGIPITLSTVALPAVNTPQFDWNRNRMPHRPRPAGTVYAPEVAARAVVRAADHGIRELFVGGSTLQLWLGQAVAPWLVDRMLARSAYAMQQTDEPARHRADNLFTPVAGPYGAHGRFGREEHGRALIVSGDAFRIGAVALGALGTMLLGAAAATLATSRSTRP